MQITERDILIIHEVSRWRFLLSRQVRLLCNFNGQRATDRRIKKLIDAGYLERRYILYGIPALLFVTRKAVQVFKLDFYTTQVRIENIVHDIAVVDTAIYLIRKHCINQTNILTERQIKHSNGFNNPKHDPDFIYAKEEKIIFVEVELSEKTFKRLESNIKTNFMKSNLQQYIIPSGKVKIIQNIERLQDSYPIEMILLEEVQRYVKTL